MQVGNFCLGKGVFTNPVRSASTTLTWLLCSLWSVINYCYSGVVCLLWSVSFSVEDKVMTTGQVFTILAVL